jgi:pathogenesis-related protein 1
MFAPQPYFSLATAISLFLPISLPVAAPQPIVWPTTPQPERVRPLLNTSTQAISQPMLGAHNQWRKRYHVPALTWSPQLAAYAQEWANRLLKDGKFEHRQNSSYGENLAWASGQTLTPERVVNMWGEEVKDYDYATNRCKPGKVCGHYTQVVWRNTKQVGCGVARGNGTEIWVCNYNPPGNFIGQKPY